MPNYNTILQSNNALISQNNTDLQELINKANALPDAGAGGDTSMEDGLVSGTLTSYSNDRVTFVGMYAFFCNLTLEDVNFPNCEFIYDYAFCQCYALNTLNFPKCVEVAEGAFGGCGITTLSFPKCLSLGLNAFCECINLTTIDLPECTYVGNGAFYKCSELTTVSFPKCEYIDEYAFCECSNLTSIYLTNSDVCSLADINAFDDTGITPTTGSIFVPASLIDSYKTAPNWSFFSDRIFGV